MNPPFHLVDNSMGFGACDGAWFDGEASSRCADSGLVFAMDGKGLSGREAGKDLRFVDSHEEWDE